MIDLKWQRSESWRRAAFRQAADIAIGRRADELGRLSRNFGYDEAYVDKDWRADVNKIVELSRANNVAPEALATCAERSIEGFASLMSPVVAGETESGWTPRCARRSIRCSPAIRPTTA